MMFKIPPTPFEKGDYQEIQYENNSSGVSQYGLHGITRAAGKWL